MYERLYGNQLEEVDCFKYLGLQLGSNEKCLCNRGLRIKTKCLYEGVIVPTLLYGAKAWGMRSAKRRKVNVLKVKFLRSLVGVSRMDRVDNEQVRGRAGE